MRLQRLALHHLTTNRKLITRVELYLRQYTDWNYSWGDNVHIPAGTSVLLIPAELFLSHRKRYRKNQISFLELVYGESRYLVDCYLAECDDFLKNNWDNAELYYRITRLTCRELFQLQSPAIIVRPTFIEAHSQTVAISAREYGILKILIQNINQVVPRSVFTQILLEREGNDNGPTDDRIIDVYICSIRKKMRKLLSKESVQHMLQSVYSSGYRLVGSICG